MTNIEKLMKFLPDNRTCAVIMSDVNRRYFTGMKSSAGTLICFKEKAYFIIDFRYIEKARSIVKDCEVILEKDRTIQINELFKKHSTAAAMIEADHMTVAQFNEFRQAFDKITVHTSSDLSNMINKMRMYKSEYEIKKIFEAQRIADETFKYVLENIKRGMTERDLALLMDNNMKKLGAEDISFDTIALSGKNTSRPHGVPGYDIIGDGFVLMDFGAVCDGLHSDMTRTIYIGNPSPEEREAYDTVLRAQLAALEFIGPGKSCRDADSVAREIIDGSAFIGTFGHSLGHGVGMEIHEKPYVSKKSDIVLESGMVITVEPGVYIPEKFGIRIEDMVIINDNSYTNFTESCKELIIL